MFGALLLCCLLCLFIIIIVVGILLIRSRRGSYRRLDKVWLVDWKDIEVDQQIGVGASGPVHHGLFPHLFLEKSMLTYCT